MDVEKRDGYFWLKPEDTVEHNLLRRAARRYIVDAASSDMQLTRSDADALAGYISNTRVSDIRYDFGIRIQNFPAFADCAEHEKQHYNHIGPTEMAILEAIIVRFRIESRVHDSGPCPDHVPEEFLQS